MRISERISLCSPICKELQPVAIVAHLAQLYVLCSLSVMELWFQCDYPLAVTLMPKYNIMPDLQLVLTPPPASSGTWLEQTHGLMLSLHLAILGAA